MSCALHTIVLNNASRIRSENISHGTDDDDEGEFFFFSLFFDRRRSSLGVVLCVRHELQGTNRVQQGQNGSSNPWHASKVGLGLANRTLKLHSTAPRTKIPSQSQIPVLGRRRRRHFSSSVIHFPFSFPTITASICYLSLAA